MVCCENCFSFSPPFFLLILLLRDAETLIVGGQVSSCPGDRPVLVPAREAAEQYGLGRRCSSHYFLDISRRLFHKTHPRMACIPFFFFLGSTQQIAFSRTPSGRMSNQVIARDETFFSPWFCLESRNLEKLKLLHFFMFLNFDIIGDT